MDQNMDQKWSQNIPKTVPSEAQTSSGVPFGFGNASGLSFHSKTLAILEEELVQNRVWTASKANEIGFQTQSDNIKRFKTDFI